MGEYHSFILLLFLPLAQATCPTTLPTDATFTMATQWHAGSYGNASSIHILSNEGPPPEYSMAYNLASGAFMETPSNQCSQSCLTRLRAMGKGWNAKDGTFGSIIMMWDNAGQSPPGTNILYAAYTKAVVPGEYFYCSNVAGTCGGSVPLYLYYNAETDDYQVRGDKDTVDDSGARLQNMALPICWLFPPLPTTSTSIGTITGSSTTTTPSGSSTGTASGSWSTTTANRLDMTVSSTTTSPSPVTGTGSTSTTKGSSDTVTSTTTTPYTGPPTTTTTSNPAASTTTTPYTGPPTTPTTADPRATTTTTPYTGPPTTSTTADPAGSTTTPPSGSSTNAGSGSTTTTVKPTTTTSPYVYDATTDISGTYGPGDQKLENGAVIRPNGDTIYPNGTVRTSDGSIIENGQKIDPDGTVHNPDGSTKYPNGTVTYPGDSTSGTGGSGGGKSGDDTSNWVIPAVIVAVMVMGVAALGMIFFGVTSMMKSSPPSSVNPYEVANANEQWPNQRQPKPSADLPPAVSEPVTTAQPQSFGATQTLQGAPNSLYFG